MVTVAPVAEIGRVCAAESDATTLVNWIWLEASGVAAGIGEDTVTIVPPGIADVFMP